MSTIKLEIARLRRELDEMDALLDAAGEDAPEPAIDFSTWLQRNRDALNESIKDARAAVERGEYFEGTTGELLDRILLTEALERAAV